MIAATPFRLPPHTDLPEMFDPKLSSILTSRPNGPGGLPPMAPTFSESPHAPLSGGGASGSHEFHHSNSMRVSVSQQKKQRAGVFIIGRRAFANLHAHAVEWACCSRGVTSSPLYAPKPHTPPHHRMCRCGRWHSKRQDHSVRPHLSEVARRLCSGYALTSRLEHQLLKLQALLSTCRQLIAFACTHCRTLSIELLQGRR